MSGANHPMYGKVPTNAFQSGYAANNPMYGKVPANAMTINVNSAVDNELVHSFSYQRAAKWLNIPRATFKNSLSSGKVWNNLYVFRKSSK